MSPDQGRGMFFVERRLNRSWSPVRPTEQATIVAGARLHWGGLAATAGILYGYQWPWDGTNGDSRSSSFVVPALSLCGRFGR